MLFDTSAGTPHRCASIGGMPKLSNSEGNANTDAFDISEANVVTLYLLPSLNMKLRPTLWKLKPGTMPANPFGQTTDGVKMNPGQGNPDLVEPAGPVDPQVWVLSVRSPDGRHIALLGNYSLHYVGGEGPGAISADGSTSPEELMLIARYLSHIGLDARAVEAYARVMRDCGEESRVVGGDFTAARGAAAATGELLVLLNPVFGPVNALIGAETGQFRVTLCQEF